MKSFLYNQQNLQLLVNFFLNFLSILVSIYFAYVSDLVYAPDVQGISKFPSSTREVGV